MIVPRCTAASPPVTLVLVLLLPIVVVLATTEEPLPSVGFMPFAYTQPLLDFSFNEANINVNQEVLGVTLQVVLEDCTQGSRWFLQPMQSLGTLTNISASTYNNLSSTSQNYGSLNAAWYGLDVIYDAPLCAVYVFKGGDTSSWSRATSQFISVSSLLQALRTIWFYNAASGSSSLPLSLRVSWTYWFGLGGFSMSVGNSQHMFSCLDRSGTALSYASAVTACQQWLQDSSDPSSIGASLVSIGSYRAQHMVNAIRRRVSAQYTDPSTGSLVGYVSLIGLFGTRSNWDNGEPLSYKNFAQANPVGNFPTVMDQDNLWKSVLAADPYSYCCETTATGPPQEISNGFLTLVSNQSAAAVAEASTASSLNVLKALEDDYFDPFYPFRALLLADVSEPVFGFTTSFHRADCDGSFRFVVDAEPSNSPALDVKVVFNDDVCAVTMIPSNVSNVNVPLSAQLYAAALGRIKVVDIRGPTQVASSGSISKRLVWGFLLGDGRTSWTMGGEPIPHYYYCTWGSAAFDDASSACAARAGGRQEAYLATPQYQWEQQLLEDLLSRGNLTYDSVWLGLDTSIGTNVFSNGDPMISGGFRGWGVNQPSLTDSPAAFSGLNANWASRSRTSTLSYCCEMTSVVSRRASGVVYVTLVSSSSVIPRPADTEHPATISVVQNLQRFRPLASLAGKMNTTLLSTMVYGVSLQLPSNNCSRRHAPAGHSLPLLAPTNPLVTPMSLCPAQPGSGGTSAVGCTGERVELMRDRANACSWTLRRTDNASAPLNVSTWMRVMEQLELRVARLPLDASLERGQWMQLSWALWSHPPLLTAPPMVLPISPSIVFHGSVASWPANRMTVSPNTGAMFLCPSPHVAGAGGLLTSTFADALTTCRDWADDAYLACVASPEELQLLALARNLSYYANTSVANSTAPPPIWIALQRNRSFWMNGDPVTYTNWGSGEPTAIGPTQMDATGTWRNVAILVTGTATQQTAAFCCKRNGYNQQTARLMGLASIHPHTQSASDSGTRTLSQQESASWITDSATATVRVTGSHQAASKTSSASIPKVSLSHIGDSTTKSVSRFRTTSAQLTTPPPTWTRTGTLSSEPATQTPTITLQATNITNDVTASVRVLSATNSAPTLTMTPPLPAVARIDWAFPPVQRFTAADIRSPDPSRRSISLESVFMQFRTLLNESSSALYRYMSLGLSNESTSLTHRSAYDFLSTGQGERWLAGAVIGTLVDTVGAEESTLTITLAEITNYFPAVSERLVLRVHRNATTMLIDQLPLELPDIEFTVYADEPAVDATTATKVIVTAFSILALGAPSSFRDIQFMTLLGGYGSSLGGDPYGTFSSCSRAAQRTLYLDGIRVVAPVHWSATSLISLWVGAGGIMVVFMVVHFVVWAAHAGVSAYKRWSHRNEEGAERQHDGQRRARYDEVDDSGGDDDDDDPFTLGQQPKRPLPQRSPGNVDGGPHITRNPPVPSTVALRFPSLSMLVLRVFLAGVVSHSLWLVASAQRDDGSYDTSAIEFVLGTIALSVMLAITLSVLMWAVCFQACNTPVFVPLPRKLAESQTATTKLLAPRGTWIARQHLLTYGTRRRPSTPLPLYDTTRSFYWICGEYATLWWVVVDWGLPWLMGWLATYSPADDPQTSCTQVFGAAAAIFFLVGIVAFIFRPLASPLANVLAALSYGVLAAIMICVVMQLEEPDGSSKAALGALRWALLTISVLRSFVALLAVQLAVEQTVVGANGPPPSHNRSTDIDFFASRRKSSDATQLGFQHGGGRTPSFAASRARSQRRLTSFARTGSVNFYEDVDPMLMEETSHGEEDGEMMVRKNSGGTRTSMDAFVFPTDDNTTQSAAVGGGNAMKQRMFSVGSMRRFGSMRAQLSAPRIHVGTVDSEGDDDSSTGAGQSPPHHHPPPPPPPAHHVGVRSPPHHASPDVAMRLSGLFSPVVPPPPQRRDNETTRVKPNNNGISSSRGPRNSIPDDPFADIPFVTENNGPTSVHPPQRHLSSRVSRLDSILGSS